MRPIVLSFALAVPLALLSGGSAQAATSACTPHLDAQGPTVYIYPDYSDPAQSSYAYDATGTHVAVITCL